MSSEQKKEPKLRFNCYLLIEGLKDVQKALRPKYRMGGDQELVPIPATSKAPQGALAFMGAGTPRTPPWAEKLDAAFPGIAQLETTPYRMVVFLPVDSRWFAVCFGYGSSALDWDSIEANFGLRLAARRFAPESVQELRSRRIDVTARTQSVSVPAGGEIRDFGVELEGEFVRKLIGRLAEDEDDRGTVVAGDSVIFRAGIDLHDVQSELSQMLEDVRSGKVKGEFSFVDSLVPLRRSESIVNELDALVASAVLLKDESLSARVAKLDHHVLEFAPPDDVHLEDVDHFQVSNRGKDVQFTSPTLSELRSALGQVGVRRGKSFLNNVRVQAFSGDGTPASMLLPLRQWLIFEGSAGALRYIHTLGRWFRLDEAYTTKLDADLAKITDVTATLALSDWNEVWHEDEYNRRVESDSPDFLNCDRSLCETEDGDRLEVCDLLNRSGYLVHVKRYNGSQTLSHLFGQGAVSAELLRIDSTFKTAFVSLVENMNPEFKDVASQAAQRVTYAIGVTDGRTIPGGLPTFSKVNLRDHAKRLRLLGAEPSIAVIKLV